MKLTRSDSIAQDVLTLYCSIKHPALEDLFLKLANVDVDIFSKWLLRSEKTVKPGLKDPAVYDALVALCSIREGAPQGSQLDMGAISKSLFSTPKLIPPILGFNTLMHTPVAKDVLEPFADIIGRIAAIYTASTPPNTAEILKDVSNIKNAFLSGELNEEPEASSKKESVAQQKLNMFQSLLVKFSDDVGNAADAAGLGAISTAVKGGALAKPSAPAWKEYIRIAKISQDNAITVAKAVADFIVKHYDARWAGYNHSLVEITFMNKAGQLTKEQVLALKTKYEEEKDIMGMLEEPSKAYPAYDTGSQISLDKHLNPDYLLLLICFFYVLQSKVGMPSGF